MDIDNSNIKILIIDDEDAIRQSFSDYLEDRDFQILTAENGRIGVEIMERELPDVVMLDLRMPEVDGLEVLRLSREFAPDTPKIVISVSANFPRPGSFRQCFPAFSRAWYMERQK